MIKSNETKTVMYTYLKDGKPCSTPNVEIAVTRRDEDTTIEVETITDGVTVLSVLALN